MQQDAQNTQLEQLTNFLQKTVAAPGLIVIAYRNSTLDKAPIKHEIFKTHAEAADFALKKSWRKFDVWFATSSFKQGWHKVAGSTKQQLRTRDNVQLCKSFYYDIDVGDGKGYETPESAVRNLTSFIASTGLPRPSVVVRSGNGLHVYWTLTEAVEPAQWLRLAGAFKRLAQEEGLKIDPAVTADTARILRPIATLNYKSSTPKAVTQLAQGKDYTYTELEQSLKKWLGSTPDSPDYGSVLPDLGRKITNTDLTKGVGFETGPRYARLIMKRCGVMKHVLDTGGEECNEPYWKDVLQVLRNCEDGEEYIHAVSDKHPGYSFDGTIGKFQERTYGMATLCSTLGSHQPDKCKSCPFASDKLKTPLQLGTEDSPLIRVPTELPNGFRNKEVGKGVEYAVKEPIQNEDGTEGFRWVWVPLTRFSMYGGMVLESDSEVIFRVLCEDESGSKNIDLPTKDLPYDFMPYFTGRGFMISPDNKKVFTRLLMSWIEQIRQDKQVTKGITHFGWDKIDGQWCFATAQKTYLEDGNSLEGIQEREGMVLGYSGTGDLDKWKEAANIIASNGPSSAAVLASSFAAPLINLTSISGAIIAITSDTGTGKTTSMKVAQSVWGDPAVGIGQTDDTENAINSKTAMLNSLPTYWDEVRNAAIDKFARIAFTITGGRDKARLRQDATAQNLRRWQTLMIAASNYDLRNFIAEVSGDTLAGSARVFQFHLDPPPAHLNTVENDTKLKAVEENYGLAGEVYAEYVVQRREGLSKQIVAVCTDMEKKCGITPNDKECRFWLRTAAVCVVGASAARQCGLVNFDIAALYQFLVEQLSTNRNVTNLKRDDTSPATRISTYMNETDANCVVVDRLPKHQGDNGVKVLRPATTHDGKVLQYIAVEDKVMYLPRTEFKQWAVKYCGNRQDANSWLRSIAEEFGHPGFRKNKEYSNGVCTLYGGVKGEMSKKSRCVIVDMNHPELRHMLDNY